MRLFPVRGVVLVAALAVAAFGTISLVSATQEPLAAPTATATPSPTATSVASAAATAAPTPALSPTPTATATPRTATATATPTPSPIDEGIGRFTDSCTNADIQVDATPPVLAERQALASGGSRVTARMDPAPLITNATPYTGGKTASTDVELGDDGDTTEKEVTVTFTATGGHSLTLTYSLSISGDAASATLSQVSGHCGPKR